MATIDCDLYKSISRKLKNWQNEPVRNNNNRDHERPWNHGCVLREAESVSRILIVLCLLFWILTKILRRINLGLSACKAYI